MNYEKAFKRAMTGLAILIGMTPTIYTVGKDIGYYKGFEDTRSEIRRDVVGVYRMIIHKEDEATSNWWKSNDTTKTTLKYAYHIERDAFRYCYEQLDDLLSVNIDKLTEKEVKESAEFERKYQK